MRRLVPDFANREDLAEYACKSDDSICGFSGGNEGTISG